MLLRRVTIACAAFTLVGAPLCARGSDTLALGGRRAEVEEPLASAGHAAIASAYAGADSVVDSRGCGGDGLAIAAVRGVAESAPGSRTGALFRSMILPGYGQLYNGQRLKSGVLLGTELALLSTALAFHLAGDAVFNTYNRQARAQASADPSGRTQQLYDRAQSHYKVRDGLLLAATGIWVLNIADAYLSGGRNRPFLDVSGGSPVSAGASRSGHGLAPLAAIRPGHAIFGLQGRF